MGQLLNGTYNAFGLDYSYEGTITASFNPVTDQFFDGAWAVQEPMGVTAGGEGSWEASWTSL